MEYKAKCVFAGTFDPPTIGHKAMIEDCLQMFGETVVAVMVNPGKTPLFTKEERAEMLRLMFPGESRVKIVCFSGTKTPASMCAASEASPITSGKPPIISSVRN